MIVGAGFAGLACARRLAGRPVDVTIVDRENYHLFTPLLYQVASALLNPSDIAVPVRRVFHGVGNVRFRLGEVVGVDFESRRVLLDGGESLPYDRVVVACGSRTSWFGLDRRDALPLKDLPDAMALRNHVLRCFEEAARTSHVDARRRWTTFVVVGGGPTGVEYAGALSELFRIALARDFPEIEAGETRIVLVEALERLLAAFPTELSAYARKELERRGVEVRLRTRVTEIHGDRVEIEGGEPIATHTIVWTAGVKPEALVGELGAPLGAGGRIAVGSDLAVEGREDAFAAGDAAAARTEPGGEFLSMMAPPAMQAGRHAAENVLRSLAGEPLRPFRYRDMGVMATIGRRAAVAALGRLRLRGFPGWFFWLAVHLYYLIGFRNRLVVLIEWAWDYFRYDRPIRIIARARRDPAGG